MTDFLYAYQPLLNLFLLNCGFAFSQAVVLRAGVFSIAIAGLASLGAYTAGFLATRYGFGLAVALPVATLMGLTVSLMLSVPLARLRGVYQAIATLAFVQIVIGTAFFAESITGGAMGLNNIPRLVGTTTLVIAVLAVAYLLTAISATRLGLAFDAIRQDEVVAGSLGMAVVRHHTLAFGLSGGIAGLFGALQAFYVNSIDPSQYGFSMLTATLAMVVLGGRRSVLGPMVGAAIMTALPEIARPLADNRLLVNGALLMLMIAFLPYGVVDGLLVLHRRRAARVFAQKREAVRGPT